MEKQEIPAFALDLPQRAAALKATEQFARANGFPPPGIVETLSGERTVLCIATAPDGQRYGIGYEWLEREEFDA